MRNILLLFMGSILISKSSAQQSINSYNCNPKVFIENQGQVVDEHGNRNNTVEFSYNDGLFNLELKKDGFSYEVFEVLRESTDLNESGKRGDENEDEPHVKIQSHRVDVTFAGANQNVILQAAYPIEGYFNFIYAPVT